MTQKKFVVILVIFLAVLIAYPIDAGIGQSAGSLDFGAVPRGGSSAIMYTILNTENSPMAISVEIAGNISEFATATPRTAVIDPQSTQVITVTVNMPRDVPAGVQYDGNVLVFSAPPPEGPSFIGPSAAIGAGVSLRLGTMKHASAVAGEEVIEPPKFVNIGAVLLVLAIALITIGVAMRRGGR